MRSLGILALAAATVAATGTSASAQTVEPPFDGNYFATDLGPIAGVPTSYGGLTVKFDDPNTLLIGGAANTGSGAVYAVTVERDCGDHIIGFVGEPVLYASAPFIDGGLAYGPDNVLFYTTFSSNTIGQIPDGEAAATKIIELTPEGVGSSTGTLNFIPDGFPGAGNLIIGSFSFSTWYTTTLTPDGAGTFDIGPVVEQTNTRGGPEGIVYIAAGNPEFPTGQALVSEYSASTVSAYELNADGAPIPETKRTFISGLSFAEGAAIDPLTGDFLFSTFGGGSRVVVVQGFNDPQPSDTDFDGDNDVDAADLAQLLSTWGPCENCPTDVTGDCAVGPADLAILLSIWGDC